MSNPVSSRISRMAVSGTKTKEMREIRAKDTRDMAFPVPNSMKVCYDITMSNEFETIKQKIALNKEYLRKTYGVDEIGVFGSFARGDNNENSDIDISIELNQKVPVGLFEFARMQFYLADLLGRKVDLVIKSGIKSLIRDRILSQLIII